MSSNASRRRQQAPTFLVTWYVALGQVSFVLFLAVCVALHPGLVLKHNEGGMSNYGVHVKTAVPYTLALALPALLSWVGAFYARSARCPAIYVVILRVYAVLITLTLLSTYTYTLDAPLKDAHFVFGIGLTVFEFVASIWLFRVRRRFAALVLIQLAAFVLEATTLVGALHLLFVTQVVSGGVFAVLLIDGSHEVTPIHSTGRAP